MSAPVPFKRNAISNMSHLDDTPLVIRVPRSSVYPDPDQPRKSRNPEKLKGLASTMLVKQLQPCLVNEIEGVPGYKLIIGEGRWLAAGINEELTGVEQFLDIIVVNEKNIGVIRSMQIVENLQREDMSEIQLARSFAELLETGICQTNEEVAKLVGLSASTVSVYLGVLAAPEPLVNLVEAGIATMDTARTVNEIHKTNPKKAAELIAKGTESGKLKRDDARDAHAVEKAKSKPNAPAQDSGKDKPPAPASDTTGIVATSRNEPTSAPGVILDVPKSDPTMLVVKAQRILVDIKADSIEAKTFTERVAEFKEAYLATDLVHPDEARAWVRFGPGGGEHLNSFWCDDLVILGIKAG